MYPPKACMDLDPDSGVRGNSLSSRDSPRRSACRIVAIHEWTLGSSLGVLLGFTLKVAWHTFFSDAYSVNSFARRGIDDEEINIMVSH